MCLTTRQTKADIAAKSIRCWKILEELESPDHTEPIIVTPYAWERVPYSVITGLDDFVAVGDEVTEEEMLNERMSEGKAEVERGYIHTYAEACGGLDLNAIAHELAFIRDGGKGVFRDSFMCTDKLKELGYPDNGGPKIISAMLCECEIPEGTPYFYGDCFAHLGKIQGTSEWNWQRMRTYASRKLRFTGRWLSVSQVNFGTPYDMGKLKEIISDFFMDLETKRLELKQKAEGACAC
jgi:hypothetical protein